MTGDIRRTIAGAARSPHRLPVVRMTEWLTLIEESIVAAEAGRPVALFDWLEDLKKDQVSRHALVRVLFLFLTLNGTTAADVARLRAQLKASSDQRRRPVRQPRRPGERLSPKLF